MGSITLKTIILGSALVVISEAYKSGAPAGVCESLTPSHGAEIQTSEFPYSFTTTKKNTQILITLKTKTTSDSFKGFIIQVRDSDGKPIGSFSTPADTKTIDCAPGKKNALTHTNNKEKKEIKTTWTAPVNFSGTVSPNVTVVRDGATYWVGHSPATVEIAASKQQQQHHHH